MITVIVPVYNVEQYLRRCLDSLVQQSYKDFEVIIVDDGSKDGSPMICDEYASKYENFSVIHQPNGGLSVARNTGINAAKGELITYVDSDDLIHKDYLSILKGLIDKYDANIACCNFKFFYEENELVETEKVYNDYCMTGEEATEKMLYGLFHGSSACAILMDTTISRANLFTPRKFHEDDLVTFKYYYSAKKVAYTEKPMYYYFQRPGSIMHSKYGQGAIDELDAGDYIVNTCKNYSDALLAAAINKKYENYTGMLKTFPELKKIDFETYKRVKTELKVISKKIFRNKKTGKRRRIYALILYIFGIKAFLLLK